MDCNSWEARPWDKDESTSNKLGCSESISFYKEEIQRFLFFSKCLLKNTCSIKSPKYYFDMYMERLPQFLDLHIGNWEVLERQIPSIYALRGN